MSLDKKNAAQWQQVKITNTSVSLQGLFSQSNVKLIRLKGYSARNLGQIYNEGKVAVDKEWNKRVGLTQVEADSWLQEGGWLGLIIPRGYIVVDIDEKSEGMLLYQLLMKLGQNFHAIETPNGYQFFFNDSGFVTSQAVKALTQTGFCVDYRLAEKGYVVLPSTATKGRTWVFNSKGHLMDMPKWLAPLGSGKQERPFTLPIEEGERNETLFRHGCRLKSKGITDDEIQELLLFMNRHLLIEPLPEHEITNMLRSISSFPQSDVPGGTVSSGRINNVELAKTILSDIPCFTYNDRLFAYRDGVYLADGETLIKQTAQERLDNDSTMHRIREVVAWIKNKTEISELTYHNSVNVHHGLLNLKNGLLDYRTGKLLDHNPDILSTVQIPVEYDPAAKCPNIERFFNQLVPQDTVPLLEEIVGYCLTTHTEFQKAFLLLGKGSNGKSTFLELLQELIGHRNVSHVSLHDLSVNRFAAAQLANKLLNVYDDLGNATVASTHQFKILVTGGDIEAEFKGQNRFTFRNMAKMLFSANELPAAHDTSDGYWRRWVVLPFTLQLSKENRVEGFIRQMSSSSELSGLLNLAIRGLLRLEQQKGFTENESTKAALQRYTEVSNNVLLFVEEECEQGTGIYVAKKELYSRYKDWCHEAGYIAFGMHKFYELIQELSAVETRRQNAIHVFKGIRPKAANHF